MLAYTTEGDAVFYSEESAGVYADALDALLSRVGELEAENARLRAVRDHYADEENWCISLDNYGDETGQR
jgi:hypothetical protein